MQLRINGEKQAFSTALTVETLLEELQVDSRQVAVERNLTIIPKSSYRQETLEDGDQIEIVEFIGGG